MCLEKRVSLAAAGAILVPHRWTSAYKALDHQGREVARIDPKATRLNSAGWVNRLAFEASGCEKKAAIATAKIGARVIELTGKALEDLDCEGRLMAARALSETGHRWK